MIKSSGRTETIQMRLYGIAQYPGQTIGRVDVWGVSTWTNNSVDGESCGMIAARDKPGLSVPDMEILVYGFFISLCLSIRAIVRLRMYKQSVNGYASCSVVFLFTLPCLKVKAQLSNASEPASSLSLANKRFPYVRKM